MAELPDDIEQQLREMSDSDWDGLTARLRSPDPGEALRSALAKYISGSRLDAVSAVMSTSAFVNEAGEVDEVKVAGLMRRMFPNEVAAGPRFQGFGQHQDFPSSGYGAVEQHRHGPMLGGDPGDRGHIEAQKRFHGLKPPGSSAGRAEAEKRFNQGGGKRQ